MLLEVIIVQFSLGVALFFILNWIGKHSYSIGYMSISMFYKAEEAPAFNFVLRVLTPVVYLIITSTTLYLLKLDKYVDRFYFVSIYYIIFRLAFNILTGRAMLLNWNRQILYWVSIIGLSILLYEKLIKNKQNIIPDFTTIANEIWIIILVFLYQIANKIELSESDTIKRKNNYLTKKYKYFEAKYKHIIDKKFIHPQLKALVYSIIIYENFNRPLLVRVVENIKFRITNQPHTLGVMQVYTNELISDTESVEKGTDKIKFSFKKHSSEYYNNIKPNYYSDYWLFNDIISDYNTGTEYNQGVLELFELIKDKFYSVDKEILHELDANNGNEIAPQAE